MNSVDAAVTLLPFILLTTVVILANLQAHSPSFLWLTYLALAMLNLMMIMAGLIGLALPSLGLPGMTPEVVDAYAVLFQAIGLTGLLGFLPFLRPVRRLVARVLPIDPDSAVHMTALVYAVYLIGQGLGQQPLLTNAEVLDSLGLQVTSGAVWAQALGLALLAMTGIGLFIRRDWRKALERMGLAPLTLRGLGVAAGGVVALMALQIVVALAWQQVDPAGFQALEDANNLLLGQFTGLGAALTIGLSAALGEELLFRGALQPRFGLLATAILFTMVHSQYGLSPATLLILAIALVLGWLRVRTSLTVCILVHFGYNFTSVLLPSLASGG